ncbi:MAG: Pycsar system effector family protein [Ignavibacteria bacterium]
MSQNDIVKKAEEFVSNLLRDKLPPTLVYHNFSHTLDVVGNTRKIGKKSGLSNDELEIVTLAAWFHDVGYTESYKGHEDNGKEIAEAFLTENNYSSEKIAKVLSCIDSTKIPQDPKNIMEQVICDADLIHLGQEDFFEYSDLLKTEWNTLGIKNVEDTEWQKTSAELLSSHKFFTPYARKKHEQQQTLNLLQAQKNYKKLQQQAADAASRKAKMEFDKEKLELEKQKILSRKDEEKLQVEIEKMAFKKESAKTAERGIETMFRNTVRTHVEFSAMADSKANIMISINTLIIGIIVTTLLRKLVEYPYLTAPTFILLAVCLTCIIFAVFVTRPSITTGMFTKLDIEQKKTNLLFFGNFFNMPLSDFQWGMDQLMHDKEYLYGSMVKDFYFLGQVLGRKYKYLRICYNIFMYGLIIAVVAYTVAFIFNPQQQTQPFDLLQ